MQLPFNVFDQRLLLDGTLKRLKDLGIEIHARSIFLQGLLLMDSHELDDYFVPFIPLILEWRQVCKDLRTNPLDLALHFAASQPLIDKVIVGISELRQLKEIVSSVKVNCPKISAFSFAKFSQTSESLVNPSLWNLKL